MQIVFYIIITFAIIFFFEIFIYFLQIITKKNIFLKIDYNLYPLNPSSYYKIAIYGGSAAAGYNAHFNFSTVLLNELKDYNDKKLFVKNYAANGMPLHNGQFKLAEYFFKKFDLSIIYSGNNDDQVSIQKSWNSSSKDYLAKINQYNKKNIIGMNLYYRLLFYIFSKSYFISFIYKLFKKSFNYLLVVKNKLRTKKISFEKLDPQRKIDSITNNTILGKKERELNYENYFSDINKLTSIASEKNKLIIIGVVNNFLFSPTQSLCSNISQKKIYEIIEHLGMVQNKLSNSTDNLNSLLEEVSDLDNKYPNIAHIYYFLGIIKLKLGLEKGFEDLDKAFELDFPIIGRSNNYKNSELQKICKNKKSVEYVDVENYFKTIFLKDSNNYDDLFSDVQHPSSLGHIIIGFSIVNAMKNIDVNLTKFDFLCDIQKNYLNRLQHNIFLDKNHYYMNFRWFISCLSSVSNKKEYLERASRNLKKWWGLAKRDTCKSEYFFWESILHALSNEKDASKKSLNRSKLINEHTIKRLKNEIGTNGIPWGSILEGSGMKL